MYWGISIAIPLIALTCYGALLFITARQGLERTVNRFFALYLLSMLVWSFGTFMMRVAAGDVLFWNKVMLGGLMGMPLAFFGFVRAFLMIKGQRRWLYLGLLLYTILLIANGMGYVSEYVHVLEEGAVEFGFGPAVPVFDVYFVFLIGFSALNLMRGYRRARDSVQSNRIRYALLGLSAIVLGLATNLVPALRVHPIDIAANVVNACLIAYAIFHYQLLDITVVFRKGLLYSVPMTMIGIFYFIAISLAVQVFHVFVGYQIFILSLLIAVVTAVVAQPLRDSAQLWIDKLFFREKYDAYLMLQKLSREVASVIHLEDLLNMVLEELAARMHIARIGVFLKGGMGNFRLAAQTGHYKNPAHLSLRKDHPVVHWLARKGNVLTRHEIGVLPHFQALWGEEREELERLGWELFIPLKAKGGLVGILAVGPKLSDEAYSQDDQLTLTALANQTAVAIENARLYEEAQQEITDRKRAEEELRQSYVKLRRAFEGTVSVLVSAIEMKDPYTAGHQRRVTQLTCAIAKEMGLPEEQIEGIRMAALIHDIGKINVPAEILSKPGPLNDLEFGLIKAHPQVGHGVLNGELEFPWPVAQIVLQHHERMDGSGYPQGLSGEEIMLEARILGVADVVEAMVSHRPYRPSRGIDLALEEISQNRGVLYDPEVVDACLKLFTEKGFELE